MKMLRFGVTIKEEDTQREEEIILISEIDNPSVEFFDSLQECIKTEYTKQYSWARGIEVRWIY